VIAAAKGTLRASYPFLTAATPVLFLAVRNVAQVAPEQVAATLLVMLLAAAAALAIVRRMLGDAPRAAVLVTAALIVLFTGGSLYELLAEPLGRSVAFVLTGALMLAVLWGTLRFCAGGPRRVEAATTTLSIMALVLFTNMAAPLLFSAKGRTFFAPDRIGFESRPPDHPVLASESPQSPDIYYIIADAYGRGDALQRWYGFDNTEFLAWLEQRGFYVAHDSWSNYAATYLSLASSLNMRLLDETFAQLRERHPDADELDRTAFYRMIQDPELARRLQARGYRYAQVLTHWGGTDRSAAADLQYRFAPFLGGEFSGTLAGMTLLRAFLPTVDQLHRFVIDSVPRIADEPGPTFAFVHLLLPHNPYVFDREGRVIAHSPLTLSMNLQESAWALREPYVEQLRYTNTALRGMIEAILARSRTPPIIVLQGDHGTALSGFEPQRRGLGPDPRERLAILNAFLVPPAVRARLRPDLTPVNSFRTVLSAQFGEDLSPLPDFSYLPARGEGPYALREVSAELRPGPSTSSR
jgi:hypothetical protein